MWALAPAGAAPSAPAASAPADTIAATNTPRRVTRAGFKRNCVIGFILTPRLLVPGASSRAPMTQGTLRPVHVAGAWMVHIAAKNGSKTAIADSGAPGPAPPGQLGPPRGRPARPVCRYRGLPWRRD